MRNCQQKTMTINKDAKFAWKHISKLGIFLQRLEQWDWVLTISKVFLAQTCASMFHAGLLRQKSNDKPQQSLPKLLVPRQSIAKSVVERAASHSRQSSQIFQNEPKDDDSDSEESETEQVSVLKVTEPRMPSQSSASHLEASIQVGNYQILLKPFLLAEPLQDFWLGSHIALHRLCWAPSRI